MKNSWRLTIIISFVAFAGMVSYYFGVVSIEELSAFGSIFAASGSIIAIVWFYSSLQQQSIQLDEQRKQFQLEFNNLRLESKRSVIMTAKNILDDMETKINNSLTGIGTLNDLPIFFLPKIMPLLKPVMESENHEEVLEAVRECHAILIPARTFLSLMKDAGSLFLENEGIVVIDDNNEPELFIIAHQEQLEKKPIISKYLVTATMLSKFMLQVRLDVVALAGVVALASRQPSFLKEPEVLKMVLDYQEKNDYLPRIAEKWLETVSEGLKNSSQS